MSDVEDRNGDLAHLEKLRDSSVCNTGLVILNAEFFIIFQFFTNLSEALVLLLHSLEQTDKFISFDGKIIILNA